MGNGELYSKIDALVNVVKNGETYAPNNSKCHGQCCHTYIYASRSLTTTLNSSSQDYMKNGSIKE